MARTSKLQGYGPPLRLKPWYHEGHDIISPEIRSIADAGRGGVVVAAQLLTFASDVQTLGLRNMAACSSTGFPVVYHQPTQTVGGRFARMYAAFIGG